MYSRFLGGLDFSRFSIATAFASEQGTVIICRSRVNLFFPTMQYCFILRFSVKAGQRVKRKLKIQHDTFCCCPTIGLFTKRGGGYRAIWE